MIRKKKLMILMRLIMRREQLSKKLKSREQRREPR